MHISSERIRRTAATGAALAVVLSLAGLPGAASAASTPAGPSPAGAGTLPASHQPAPSMVTLITGDKVAVTTGADGRQSANIVDEAGSSKQFEITSGPDGDLYVYPDDALPGVSAGIVDRELFNVTRAVKDGYGDTKSGKVPAIVDFQGTPSAAALKQQSEKLPGSESERVMPRLGLTAVNVDKAKAASFWNAVKPRPGKARSGAGAVSPGSAGVAKLWYDGRAEVTLDHSVAQIGAPEAWAEGYDGKGVKVAVLDTGADLNNADIAPRIAASQSFIAGETVQDGHGHGTHVASTVVGSGANSGGRYKGVAPGADLLVGKVLSNEGSGSESEILAGMEWAVAQHADIVSMSLGVSNPDPDGDALTEAVDWLSASTGTLFVIAAGNDGRKGESTLGSPGVADAALTVGAVDGSDVLADFSSRGPRLGDMAIKPEITAPGVDIVAARAAGTAIGTPVDAHYTALSGTSMATPHVAGAAAILAQRHPDWTGQRIKQALAAHSKRSDSQTVYQQGYGRVDIPAALDSTLELSGKADFGLIKWQKDTYKKQSRTITFRNAGASDATVTPVASAKGSDGKDVAEGAIVLSSSGLTDGKLTVPAGGSAEVTVTLDPNVAKAGQYSGYVTATAADGASVHTPIGFLKDAEHRDVTVKFTDRFGNVPQVVNMTVHGMDNSTSKSARLWATDSATFSLPVGRYSIEGSLYTAYPGGSQMDLYSGDLFTLPEIDLADQDRTFAVDGTTATDFTAEINGEKRPLEDAAYSIALQRHDGTGGHLGMFALTGLRNTTEQKFGAIPSEAATTGALGLESFLTRREPLLRASVTSPGRLSIPLKSPQYAQRFEGTKNVPLVDAGTGTEQDFATIGVTGKAVLISAYDTRSVDAQVRRAAAAGAVAVIVAPSTPGPRGSGVAGDLTIPVVDTSYDSGRTLLSLLAKGKVTIRLDGALESGYTYSAQFADNGRIPASLAKTAATRDFAKVHNTFHSDQTRHMGYEALSAWSPGQPQSIHQIQNINLGVSRDDYILASPDLDYQPTVYSNYGDSVYMQAPRLKYSTPGKNYQQHWFAAPMRVSPYDSGYCTFCRTDTWMRGMSVGYGGDSDPTHVIAGQSSRWRYFRDGEQITDPGKLMVPQKADYQFVQDLTRARDSLGVTLGGKVHTEWNFTSAAATGMAVKDCEKYQPKPTVCESMPAVMLGYDVPLNILNQAAAGRAFAFTVDAGRPKGWTGSGGIAGAKVSVSYDDGATWKSAKVLRKDSNSFRALVLHPEAADTNGFVTLKTEAWDAAGNRTVQTITRAYALK
ncbi:S8 family serine peptidase [Streptomyces sp. NPDC002012]|uniref:S8 family serine peptidase n=1 Tax=Streptomyces sp. NPDC002012 TaxID=3154532 RepID=UPI00332C0D00